MNTTKRMLRFAAAAMAVAFGCNALAQGLSLPVKQGFEDPLTAGTFATNLIDWASTSEDDASVITNMTYEFDPGPAGISFPLTGETHFQVLRLNTEGGVLSANLDTAGDATAFSVNPIYVDTMVNFVISEDDPSFAGMDDVKIAVFANASSNLVIRHGVFDETFDTLLPTNSVTGLVVDPAEWYRLTITLKFISIAETLQSHPVFKVFLNGTAVEHENDYGTSGWLLSAVDIDKGGHDLLTAVSFQGTGYIDDLVVTRDDPFAPPPTAFFTVYTVVGPNGSSDVDAVKQVARGSNLTIVYTANQWYRIGALEKDGTAVAAAAGQAAYTQELTDIQADISNNVSFAQATTEQTGLAVPAGWASQFYGTETAALADLNIAEDYLLGLDPTGEYDIGLEISAITVDNTVTVTCVLSDGENPLQTTINGSLTLYGKVALDDDAWTEIAVFEIVNASFDENGEAVLGPEDADTYNFFKAVIE